MEERKLILPDVENHTRDSMVNYYAKFLISMPSGEDVKKVNERILSKWEPSGLEYIKVRAWKLAVNHCECRVVLIMRDKKTQIPYCGNCKKQVIE